METSGAEARETARELHAEAHRFIDEVGLGRLLAERFGTYSLVGSVDLDLMTRPDIDIYVPFERGDPRGFLEALAPLHSAFTEAGHMLFRATFNDEWTVPRGDYGSGYYWGLKWRTPQGRIWKLDLWGWDPETYARKLAEHEALGRALAGKRDLVLRLKTQAQALPGAEARPTSWDVYQFVRCGEGDSLEQLRAFCRARAAGLD
jgi:hypothetical protein